MNEPSLERRFIFYYFGYSDYCVFTGKVRFPDSQVGRYDSLL